MSVPELTLHMHVSYEAQYTCPTRMGFTQESAGGTGFREPFGGSLVEADGKEPAVENN